VTLTRPTLEYLYGLQTFGMKLGLHNIRALLRFCHDPHKQFRSVHVAGTNGKGSTSAMIAAVLQSAGYRTALYTSPHLVKFNERIRINGEMISDADLVRYAGLLRPKIDDLKATFFEATTAIAFMYFADKKVDIAVIETGLGGRLDATNVLVPEVSVITSISKDHMQQLGRSLRKIAIEKGGIIKRGKPCVVGAMDRNALLELRRISKQRRSRLITAGSMRSSKIAAAGDNFQITDVHTEKASYDNLRIPLLGRYQAGNMNVALSAIECLQFKGMDIPASAVRRGFERVDRLTGIRGRFEILQHRPLIILDVGHNPEAISATVDSLRGIDYRKLILVFGVMKDKEYRSMIRMLAALRPSVFAVQPATERALSAAIIVNSFRKSHCEARSYANVAEGIQQAIRIQKKNDAVLICGSHYVAGEALQAFPSLPRRKSS
jgi:dihydrofolate synthase/folylpolyglutamate synthase